MQTVYTLLGQPLQAIALHPNANPTYLLDNAAEQIDDKLIGYTPPGVLRTRREIAWVIFTLIVGGGLAWSGWAFTKARKTNEAPSLVAMSQQASQHGAGKRREGPMPWIFMAPALLSIALWSYYPLTKGLVMAFQNYRLVGDSSWIGLDNFIDAATSYTFWIGILNALLYTLYTLVLGFFLPIFLAIMLNEIPKGTLFFRFLFYLPAITASLVVSLLWGIFESGDPSGLLNQIIGIFHIPAQNWLGDTKWAMLAIVVPAVWQSAGPGCIIYLAALKSIPTEFYEAADLDGAGVFTKLRMITFPMLKPLIVIQLVGAVVAAFQVTDRIMAMTGGGPLYATHTIGLEIYYNAFMYLKFGYATAAAWMVGAMLIGFTIYQLRIMKNVRFAASGRD
jgi:multiple sugar transport system permease protein